MSPFIFSGIIFLLVAYLAYDIYSGYRTDKILERINQGFSEIEDDAEFSMWDGASDLLQLNYVRNLLLSSALSRKLDQMIRRSGVKTSFIQVVTLMFTFMTVGALAAYFLTQNINIILGVLFAIPLLIWVFFQTMSTKMQARIDDQLPGMVTSLLTTIRSGGTPIQALQATVKNAANPMRSSIENVMNNLQLGKTPNVVWKDWSDFWGTKNTKLLATGIRLKWEAGGEMTTILEHILESIEFNKRIELKVRTLTAQSKASAFVLGALPFLLFALQYYKRPDLIQSMMNSEVGKLMLIYAFSSSIIGLFVLLKIAKLKS